MTKEEIVNTLLELEDQYRRGEPAKFEISTTVRAQKRGERLFQGVVTLRERLLLELNTAPPAHPCERNEPREV